MQLHGERRTCLSVCVVGGLLFLGMTESTARSESPLGLRIVPVSATGAHEIVGDTIFLDTGGQSVTLEYRLSGWDPDLDGTPRVKLYQLLLDVRTFARGYSGHLDFATIPCETDDDCFNYNYQSSVCEPAGVCDFFSSLYVDEPRADFLFAGLDTISLTSMVTHWLASVVLDNADSVADTGEEKYLGTIKLDVSSGAAGWFEVAFDESIDNGTFVQNEMNQLMALPGIHSAWIVLPMDCNNNGRHDDLDIDYGVSDDCNVNWIPDECEPDCNGNGVTDECDIAGGVSEDCTGNGAPDECETDCNGNSVADSCDVAGETELDENDNQVPDQCDGSILYVNAAASGVGNGMSWKDAFVDLQNALTYAATWQGTAFEIEEIWVAAGTYVPSRRLNATHPRSATFSLVNGVALYGGFAGGEVNRDDRNHRAHVTVLSGDHYGNDGPAFEGNAENSYHVVMAAGVDETTILDGFTITGGNADGTISTTYGYGGGIYCITGDSQPAKLTIVNCTLVGNSARHGGGINSNSSDPTLINCRVIGNTVEYSGGGARFYHGWPTLINSVFSGNSSGSYGGGIYVGDATLVNCSVFGNVSAGFGGGIYAGPASPQLTA